MAKLIKCEPRTKEKNDLEIKNAIKLREHEGKLRASVTEATVAYSQHPFSSFSLEGYFYITIFSWSTLHLGIKHMLHVSGSWVA